MFSREVASVMEKNDGDVILNPQYQPDLVKLLVKQYLRYKNTVMFEILSLRK